MSPRIPQQHQQSQPLMHATVTGSGFPVTTEFPGQTLMGQGLRSEHSDNQSKNSVFSNALSNPVRQVGEVGNYTEDNFLQQQSRDSASFSFNDAAMDMHSD